MNRDICACRTSFAQTVNVGPVESASVIGFEHEAGLMIYVPPNGQPQTVKLFAAPKADGPYLPVRDGAIELSPGEAIPVNALAFPACFLKLVGEPAELEISIKA